MKSCSQYAITYYHVGKVVADNSALVAYLKPLPAFHNKSQVCHFKRQRTTIDRFQKPWAWRAMHVHGAADDLPCETLVFH